nr:zinc finger protein 646 [Nerophis lumbriciformis]
MPSAHGPHNFIMERQKSSSFSPAPLGGEACTFICTECGDGFPHYTQVIAHMTIHGPLESFSFDGSSNGFEVPREYVLQENGTLAVVNGFSVSQSSPKPASPEALPHFPSALPKPPSPNPQVQIQKPQLSNADVNIPKPSPLNVEKPQKGHYRCEICSKSFNTLQSLRRHQQYNNTEEGYKCTLCCKAFVSRLQLKAHFQDHARQPFHCCSHCGKRFVKAYALVAHEKENHLITNTGNAENNGEKPLKKTYPCRMCKLHFFWISDFQTHTLNHCKGRELNTNISDIPLENCYSNGTLFDIENGNEDVGDNTSQIDISYKCGFCGDHFQKLTALKKHRLTHQTQEEIDLLDQDSLIPKRKIKPRSRRRRASQNGKLFSCKLCPRVFNHSSSLSRHMRYHKGTMHQCTLCGRRFPQRCDLTHHVARFHKDNERTAQDGKQQSGKQGRANYKCLECGKTFGLMYVYQRHLTYHKKGRNKCHLCSAHFMTASALGVHLQNHPNGESKCDVDLSSPVSDTNVNSALVTKSNAENIEEEDMVDHTPNDKRHVDNMEEDDLVDCSPNDMSHADNKKENMVGHTPNDKSHVDNMDEDDLADCSQNDKSHLDNIENDDLVDHTPNEKGPVDNIKKDDLVDDNPNEKGPVDNIEEDDLVDHSPNDKSHVDNIEDNDMVDRTPNNKDNSEVLYECTECTETFSCSETFLQHQTSHVSKNNS